MAALAVFVVAIASPASASHDEYGPGTLVLADKPGPDDHVIAVFAPDADAERSRRQVERAAEEAGAPFDDVEVVENADPDTLRVIGHTPVADRSGFLARHVPAERVAAWGTVFDGSGDVYLDVSRWARVEGAELTEGGDYLVSGDRDVVYRISVWALLLPVLLTVVAALGLYGGMRAYGATVVGRSEPAEERLHRIRRMTIAVQFVVPIALIVVLFATRTARWAELALAEAVPGLSLPGSVSPAVGVAGFFVPWLVLMLAAVAAAIPYDRRLRDTKQSTREGLGQAARALILFLFPLVLLVAIQPLLATQSEWVTVPIVLLLAVGFAAIAPLVINTVLRTRRLDDPLRSRIMQLCDDQDLRVRQVRLLDSRGGQIANAMISGILPQLRYVYVTDHLIEILEEEELEAVVAHEIGHGKGHHVLIKLVVVFVTLAGLAALLAAAGSVLFESLVDVVGVVPAVLIGLPLALVVVLVLAHGLVGVALEKRADDYAVDAVGARPLAGALDKLADANKVKRRTGWLWNLLQSHPGMEQRIQRLAERDSHQLDQVPERITAHGVSATDHQSD